MLHRNRLRASDSGGHDRAGHRQRDSAQVHRLILTGSWLILRGNQAPGRRGFPYVVTGKG
jgi:hypothetical protein